MHTKAEAVAAIRQMFFWERSTNFCQVTKVKKKTYYILDVALLEDHKVKLKVNERFEQYLGFSEE